MMHTTRKPTPESRPNFLAGNHALCVIALLYFVAAGTAAYKISYHTEASTQAIERILDLYNLKNESAKSLAQFDQKHPFLGFFLSKPVENELELPSKDEAMHALYTEVAHNMKTVRAESNIAAWWSWYLLSLSLFYAILVVTLERSVTARSVIFALNSIALTCFFIGILAPAMVVWTSPSIPMEFGTMEFVVQHQVRGIAAIIWELLTSGHVIIGGFLLLFSIITPLTKASATYFAVFSPNKELNLKIGNFLHTIGKWSMADVFVAAVLLALYALKAQQATKSIPCLGLYYFIGYCLFALATTELLVHSGLVTDRKKTPRKMGLTAISALFIVLIAFISGTGLYTYEQYTVNTKQSIKTTGTPGTLNNSDLVLPAHK